MGSAPLAAPWRGDGQRKGAPSTQRERMHPAWPVASPAGTRNHPHSESARIRAARVWGKPTRPPLSSNVVIGLPNMNIFQLRYTMTLAVCGVGGDPANTPLRKKLLTRIGQPRQHFRQDSTNIELNEHLYCYVPKSLTVCGAGADATSIL